MDKRSSRLPVTEKNTGSNPVTLAKTKAREAEAVKRPVVDREEVGSMPATSAKFSGVAQGAEHSDDNRTVAGSNPAFATTFINATNHGLKVKMPDSVHIFLPGETIEFLPKELGEDGADRELARRARRAEMKSKASMDWAKRNKGK